MIEAILILLAGGIIGIWHERDKAQAARKAYRQGEAHARQRQKMYAVYSPKPREAIPVPGYEMGREVPSYIRKAQAQQTINQIATQAVTLGRAAGRVQ